MHHSLNNTVKWSMIDLGWKTKSCITKSSIKLLKLHFLAGKIKLTDFFFACVLYMHVLTEFRCKHLFRFLWKFSVFWCQLDNCFDGTPGNIWLPVDIIISFPGDIAFLVWVKKTCWTKYLHRDFKLVRKVCVYSRNILNNFADWKRKCIPASILIVYWKHWDCLM